ncbi:hypothetical protein Pan97_02820 [Bremerella volcania]|uniref:Core-binding (CB) domain-containing protein n=1 Tax=Bremerella volcania TaxID=2527984 RepID=A0A518C276_9BACT|nr:hypothetical protein [Bremerella volcania]QDU73313.1 hypothetical protein Pan97_02820 [Bremerella volcania]
MFQRDSQLSEVLDCYAKFLQDKNLALDNHRPYLARRVREFLLFAQTHAGYRVEQSWICFWTKWAGGWAPSRGFE